MLSLRSAYLHSNCNNFQEQNTVPSLRRALKDVAMEKDAAVVARVHNFSCILVYIKSSTCSFYALLIQSDVLV